MNPIKIIECPRDAWQGLDQFVPTEKKIEYLKLLLDGGFDTVDYASFVSPKAIPQMKDSHEVTQALTGNTSKLLAIIANVRGAEDAVTYEQVSYLGFPLSLSETFQLRNTNKSIDQALDTVKTIKSLCDEHEKELVIYLSMGFGNPYGDPYTTDVIHEFVEKMKSIHVGIISLADTIGAADPNTIHRVFSSVIPENPDIEFGAHLHSTREAAQEKIAAAYEAGCYRFDGAIKGYGGCPMAEDDLVGNIPTELVIEYFQSKGVQLDIEVEKFNEAMIKSGEIF